MCHFKDNKAFNKVVTYFGDDDIKGYENTAHGGAINTNASLTCINSTFTGNYPKDPSVKYQELKFENYGLGGAIFSCIYELEQDEESSWWQEYPAGPLNLINCTFNENYDSISSIEISYLDENEILIKSFEIQGNVNKKFIDSVNC